MLYKLNPSQHGLEQCLGNRWQEPGPINHATKFGKADAYAMLAGTDAKRQHPPSVVCAHLLASSKKTKTRARNMPGTALTAMCAARGALHIGVPAPDLLAEITCSRAIHLPVCPLRAWSRAILTIPLRLISMTLSHASSAGSDREM